MLKRLVPRGAYLLLLICFVIISYASPVLAQQDRDIYKSLQSPFQDEATTCSNNASASAPTGAGGTPAINLTQIVNKYDLHSAIITKINGEVIAEYNSKKKPSSPASTMKVVIAEVALRNKIDLNKRVEATPGVLYNSAGNDSVIGAGETVTLGQAIIAMLSKSSNVGANMLIKELGGINGFSQKAHAAGYEDTTVYSIYHDPPGRKANESTIADQAKAMSNIQTAKEDSYDGAKNALGIGAKSDNQFDLDSYKNKWGGTTTVASNVGAYKIGDGKYIIGSYHLGDLYTSDEARYSMHDGTEAIIKQIEESAGGGSSDPANPATTCCGDDAGTTLPGKNNAEKIWNYLVTEMGFSNIQAAGIMGNIDQESGFDPNAVNPRSGAYGIAQWLGGRLTGAGGTGLISFAASKNEEKSDLGVQLEFLKKELEGSYKASVLDPIKASSNLAEVIRIWLEKFEIPCTPGSAACDAEMNVRTPKAQTWIDGSGAGGGSTAPSGCPSGTPTGELAWPLDPIYPVTSCYGYARNRLHTGIDIGAPAGVDIKAADSGTVELARDSDPGGFGKAVIIKHTDSLWTLYAHLQSVKVSQGDRVSKGDVVGTVNNTGSSRGNHLHFNVQTQGREGAGSKDPLEYLPKDGRGISGGDCPSSLDP